MINVRLHFSKTFEAKYISHLDLTRCFSRALKKSGLPLWYTEGFNTHLYLTFALPLSLGQESLCETVDIRLLSDEFDPNIVYAINPQLPKGIEVFDANIAEHKVGDIAYARYIIEMCDGDISNERIREAAEKLLSSKELLIEKKNKKGIVKETDIKPAINKFKVYLRGEMCYLELILSAGSESPLNPSVLTGLIFGELEKELDHLLIKRTQILTKNMDNFR